MSDKVADIFLEKIQQRKNENLYRQHRAIQSRHEAEVVFNDRKYINFSSNDYLSLSQHQQVKQAFADAALTFGFGSGSSVIINGYSESQRRVEQEFAALVGRESAMLFSSGYHANMGVLSALVGKGDRLLADKLIHASLIDSAQLSKATLTRYPHQDITGLSELATKLKPNLILTESVFSMEGQITDCRQVANIAQQNKSMLCIDDAHGIGVIGETGLGVVEAHNLSENVLHCLISPLGKAIGGFGAFVSGKRAMVDWIRQSARSYHYSTSLPRPVCEAISTSLQLLKKEAWRLAKLRENIQFFIDQATIRSLPLVSRDLTPIKSILIGATDKALAVEKKLLEQNIYANCIRPPTVPVNKSRIRVCINTDHSHQQIIVLLDQLERSLC
ncbi:8-amino-7-oxononanoate synthase [Francisellaceae bacterium]|nr:8-amino-7-oxononanoate synthase [Francisellaceae bacterium]